MLEKNNFKVKKINLKNRNVANINICIIKIANYSLYNH